jgi:virulence factor Mce-like protein
VKVNNDRLRLEIRRARGPFALLIVAFVLTGIAAAGILRNLAFNKPWVDTYTVRATFSDAKGIVAGSSVVRLAGINVGVVDGVDLQGRRVVLTLRIEKKYGDIYRDARMRIRPVSPLDDTYVSIDSRGSAARGPAEAAEPIPGAQTESPVDISRVLNVFNADTGQHMAALTRELGRALPDDGAQLRAALVEFRPFFTALKQLTDITSRRATLVKRLVTNTGTLSKELGRRDRQLQQLVTSGNSDMAELAARDRPLDATLQQLPGTLQQLDRSMAALDVAREHLDPALRALVPPAKSLAPALSALTRVSESGLPAVRSLNRPVAKLSQLSAALPPTVSSLTRAVRTLRDGTPPVAHSVAKLPPCFESIEDFFAHTMSLTKFYDGYRTVARATAGEGVAALTGQGVNEPSWRRLKPCYKETPAAVTTRKVAP